MDPLAKEYPELTPYHFASNTPIEAVDLDGLAFFSSKDNPNQVYNGPVTAEFIKSNNLIRTDLSPNSSSPPQPQHTLITSFSSGLGFPGLQASAVRLNYAIKSSQLKPLYNSAMSGNMNDGIRGSHLRNQYVLGARRFTPEPYLSFAEDLKASHNLINSPNGKFYKTNVGANLKMGAVGGVSVVGLEYGMYSSYKTIDASGYDPNVIAEEGGTWAGAFYGGMQGGSAGASFGPWGALGGSITGSLVDGFVGKGTVQTLVGTSNTAMPDKDPSIVEADATRVAEPTLRMIRK